ncbi:MAG TPA: signal peptidase II [Candidatus Krumholzibacteria bacterium]|nr:signal peptidase II [Candidatus Krumholzibacteria bacterium]HPD71058.1 signal peptidase II [Candidatus Krumholzibacteria bacterium]HRY39242.1 signal peptidase II [Candidatus Krumholzibacteria bacterium]
MQRREPWLWAAGIWVADFVTKRLVLANADLLRSDRVEILGDFFRLAYVRNPGAAMGLTPFGRWMLVAISAGAAALLIWFLLVADRRQRARRLAMGLILGGALGNLIDRLFYDGLVVDFLDFGIGPHRFWTFNVADIGVSCGGCLLLLCLAIEEIRERRARGKHHA